MQSYENRAKALGYKVIGGCDEAGRGPMAGPLVVACVVLDSMIEGLNDSKQLSSKKREMLYDKIISNAKAYDIVVYSVDVVDKLNVYQASKQGMEEAIKNIGNVDYVLTDAMPLNLTIPSESIIKGDTLSMSIAAASILAKVTRDQIMTELSKEYPLYGFERHKGYPTKAHKEAIIRHGICPEHRKTFAPVKAIIEKQIKLDL